MEPGTKIAVISKSGEGAPATHVAPSEEAPPQPPPQQAAKEEKPIPNVEVAPPAKEKVKTPSSPPKTMASEPQLPPKDRERRVSVKIVSPRTNSLVITYAYGTAYFYLCLYSII